MIRFTGEALMSIVTRLLLFLGVIKLAKVQCKRREERRKLYCDRRV